MDLTNAAETLPLDLSALSQADMERLEAAQLLLEGSHAAIIRAIAGLVLIGNVRCKVLGHISSSGRAACCTSRRPRVFSDLEISNSNARDLILLPGCCQEGVSSQLYYILLMATFLPSLALTCTGGHMRMSPDDACTYLRIDTLLDMIS